LPVGRGNLASGVGRPCWGELGGRSKVGARVLNVTMRPSPQKSEEGTRKRVVGLKGLFNVLVKVEGVNISCNFKKRREAPLSNGQTTHGAVTKRGLISLGGEGDGISTKRGDPTFVENASQLPTGAGWGYRKLGTRGEGEGEIS